MGCCDLEPRYSLKDLTEAVEQLSQVRLLSVEPDDDDDDDGPGVQSVYQRHHRGGDGLYHHLQPGWSRDVLPPHQGDPEAGRHSD